MKENDLRNHIKIGYIIQFHIFILVHFIIGITINRYLLIKSFAIVNLYQNVEEFINTTTMRTFIDTNRSTGVYHIIIQATGNCDINNIKTNITNKLVNRKNDLGELCFPKLKKVLGTCWYNYVWLKDTR